MMKECPVCKALSFDDMDICFGCLYAFDSESAQNDDLVDLAEPSVESVHILSDSTFESRSQQRSVETDFADEKLERGAHRKRAIPPSEAAVSSEKHLVVIPLEKVPDNEKSTADGKSGYRIEINVVC
ncbi:MAG: hypothetical protein RR619_07910, partial [Raoultibacter sp.]